MSIFLLYLWFQSRVYMFFLLNLVENVIFNTVSWLRIVSRHLRITVVMRIGVVGYTSLLLCVDILFN